MKQNFRILLTSVSAVCLMLAMLFTASTASAQQAAGAITGLVLDPSGAAVANATVTVREVAQGTTWTAKTTDAGLYNFPVVPVGDVTMKVEAVGFGTQQRNAFKLDLNQVARVDFKLKVSAGKTETVTVTEAPPLLQTASTEVGTIIDADAAVALPLATRDVNQLALLAPGVISPNIFGFQLAQTTMGTGRPYVNGAREQDNSITLDGLDISEPANGDVAYTPAPDAISEFNMITSNAPADYGSYIGAVIVESIKSGTNNYHGNAYEYVRNDVFNANTWQNKATGYLINPNGQLAGKEGTPEANYLPRPILRWNEFGGTVGGPIIKNKLFFFADEESSILSQPKTAQTNAPNFHPEQLTGDFTAYCTTQVGGGTFDASGICHNTTSNKVSGQLYQPQQGVLPTARVAIARNQISSGSFDAVASKLIALPAFMQQFSAAGSTYFQSGYTHVSQGDAKIDWQPTQNDHIVGRYTQAYTENSLNNGTNVLSPNQTGMYPLKNFVVSYVRTLTPTVVNEFHVGAQIFPANDQVYSTANGTNLNSEIGLPGVSSKVLPSLNIGLGTVGGTDQYEVFHDTTYELYDALTWTKGKHSVHAGFEIYDWRINALYPGNNGAAGSWAFDGTFTGNTGVAGGSGLADFELGMPDTVAVGSVTDMHLVNSAYSGFLQDTYTASHNLTLNLGVRYEVDTPRVDKNNALNINYDLFTGNPSFNSKPNTYKGKDTIQPRIGFAYTPDKFPGTVIRGAYTISTFMEGVGVSNFADANPPYSVTTNITNASPTQALPVGTLSQGYTPYSAACTDAQFMTLAPNCVNHVTTHATNPNFQPAMNQQWNLAVQHQFKNNLSATLGYVGNKDDHMTDIYAMNQGVLHADHTVSYGQYMENLVMAGAHLARYNASDAISRYEALEFTLSQKNYHGLDLQANYTWSKDLSNSLGYFGSYGDEQVGGSSMSQNEGGGNFFQNEYDPRGDYGRSSIDAASSFNAYALYRMPFGKGKQFLGGASPVLDEVVGGWSLALSTTLRSGFAISASDGEWLGDLANPLAASTLTSSGVPLDNEGLTNGFSYMPQANCDKSQPSGMHPETVQIGNSIGKVNLNPAYASPQANYDFGHCGVGTMRGPGLQTADLDVTKSFSIYKDVKAQLVAQFNNLTNTPIFGVNGSWDNAYSSCEFCNGQRTVGPNGGTWGTVGTYGMMQGANPGRQMQFALKISF